MDPALTIAGTTAAALAAVYAGLCCVKKCPPGKAMVIVKPGEPKPEYKVVTGGQTMVIPGVERVVLLDLTPFEVLVADALPESIAAGQTLYLHANLRICIAEDETSLKLAASHFEGLNTTQIIKMVSKHLAAQPLSLDALPKDLTELSDATVSGERLKNFWNDALGHLGLRALKYEFSGITKSEEMLPHTPYGGEDVISQLCNFIDFEMRNEHFDLVIDNPKRFADQLWVSFTLAAKVNTDPKKLAKAAETFLGKDADDVKTTLSTAITRIADDALYSSGMYALVNRLEEEGGKIGLGKAQNTKQFALRSLNAIADQSLSWRGKLSLSRFVWSAIKTSQQLHETFLRNIRAYFTDLGMDLEEVQLGVIDIKNPNRAIAAGAGQTGTLLMVAENEVCAHIEARWPIMFIETRTALVHANVCLRNADKDDYVLQPVSEELQRILTSSLEAALNSSKWREFFTSIEKVLSEIGPEELERNNLRTDRALEDLVDRIGATAFFLKLAKILLSGLEAYGEARRRFISISGDELRKRNLAINTFAVINIDLDRA